MAHIIQNFNPFPGKHCETTATGCLLKNAGIHYSEPMMLGLGNGFGFIYWKMSFMDLPFIGGRSKPFDLTRTFCSNMNIRLEERETGSKKKAWDNVKEFIDRDIPVGLQLDCYHLEHFNRSFHFAGHFLCVYGYDDKHAYVFDTGSYYKVGLENLEAARFEKGSMAARARSWTLCKNGDLADMKSVIPESMKSIAFEFLNPPLQNFGYKGIHKLSREMLKWFDRVDNPEKEFTGMAMIMEDGGTGGAVFRNFFRDFLKESQSYYQNNDNIEKACKLYAEAAANWTNIASLISKAGRTSEQKYLVRASDLCGQTAVIEKEAMELLLKI
jgi:hypothetical protein